ncbi:integrase core domain-containing protein [Streptosporangium sp. NPDC023825]|uniref:integrase core domain-containing protein n=1 Tax=Streptosporangium sp. NPDC023825 TaxID=3154909 RepID=UPI0034317641
MTSIDRIAYPRFARVVSGRELVESFSPTDAEVSWARVGSALDNAAAEAFTSTIKVEYIHRHRFATRHEARLKISTWIVDFHNLPSQAQRLRRHVTHRLRTLHGRSQDGSSRITEPSTISGN